MTIAPDPLLSVRGLTVHFPTGGGLFGGGDTVKAVTDVSFDVARGETLGLVGETGCGKSTIGRSVLRLVEPTKGSIRVAGTEIGHLGRRALRPHRRKVQMVFQDPFSSLTPGMTVGDLVAEPLLNYGLGDPAARMAEVKALFAKVGLDPARTAGYPHEFSGGQRQRIGLARALALDPDLVVADEPVSALDASVQAQVVNLLVRLQKETGLSYLFISHDLSVVAHVSHRVAVMYLGRLVEVGPTAAIFTDARHPYTRFLIDAAPVARLGARRDRQILEGDVPSPIAPPPGCAFHTRCPLARAECRESVPVLTAVDEGHSVACHVRAPASATPPTPTSPGTPS